MTSTLDFARGINALWIGMAMRAAHDPTRQTAPHALRVLGRPKALAFVCIGVLIATGWIYLGLVVAGMSGIGVLEALCRPGFGAQAGWSFAQAGLVLSMWCAMALAMMLPTAGPMILTYADLVETAARKGEPAASPLVLTAGYVSIWLGAASVLAATQLLLMRLAVLDPAMATASPLFSGAMFVGAGLYQFSALKHACVTQCQHPFRFFFANWTADPRGVFRLGFRQGLYCLGCCWAMMLLMFAVGVMNVVWMAALGAIMAVEKINSTTRFSRALGAVFVLVGIAFIVTSVIAHWPMKSMGAGE
jgi:predicted metal-binding membrane protein